MTFIIVARNEQIIPGNKFFLKNFFVVFGDNLLYTGKSGYYFHTAENTAGEKRTGRI